MLGLFADALFGVIAIINSYIGIRQELKAKRTLDELAVLVAPQAKVDPRRRGGRAARRARSCPATSSSSSPATSSSPTARSSRSRGLTLDESLLTGEADGVRKGLGDRALSGSFCLSGSGSYQVDAVREESYAGKLAGEARAFRHPPSPLQDEVNRVIVVCTYVMIPLAVILLLTFQLRSVDLVEAAQTATAGLVTLIPEGLVLLMSVTFAVAAVRLAGRDTLVQQMSATESLAAVDTICVDKTGTLTDGNLKLLGVEIADSVEPEVAQKALGRFALERRRAQPDPRGDRRALPGRRPGGSAARSRSPRSGSGAGCGSAATSYVLGAPDILEQAGALTLPPGLQHKLDQETEAGRRVVAFGESTRALPDDPAERAAAAAEGRWRWSSSRRRCAPTPPRRSPRCARRTST